jgi:hypothetical protein
MTVGVGVYPGVSREVYDSWPYANHSTLVKFNDSAAHAQEYILNPPPPTEALELGQAVHQAVLEPGTFVEEWVMGPLAKDGVSSLARRSNADKATWAEFNEQNRGKGILKAADWHLCQELRHACWAHPYARQLLGGAVGANELSCIFEDESTAMRCKMRLDRFTSYQGVGAIVELKTAITAHPRRFGAQAARLGYFSQAWQYRYGLAQIDDQYRRFFWIVVEKTPPYVCAVYEAAPTGLEAGAQEFQAQIQAYARAKETGVWPGYTTEIEPIFVPRWMRGAWEGEDE